jgi:hypothetical protein
MLYIAGYDAEAVFCHTTANARVRSILKTFPKDSDHIYDHGRMSLWAVYLNNIII